MNASPASGLIHAFALDNAGGCRAVEWQSITNITEAQQDYLWLHFDFEKEDAKMWLRDKSGLNDIAVRALLAEDTRPRTISRGDNLLLALRGMNLNPGAEPDDMVSLRIWTNGRVILSTRRRSLQATEEIIEDLQHGHGSKTTPDLLVSWIDRIVHKMNGTVDNLEEQMLALEDRVLDGGGSGIRPELSSLRRQCIAFRRYLSPQREAMNRLCNEQVTWLDELNRIRLREVNDRLIRHIEDIDEVRERAAMAQEELLSQMSEQMNQRTYVFTIIATLFLPLGFFTGLMGINVGGMPGVEDGRGFWIVVAMSVGIAGILAIYLKKKRWF
jgi:zinc transporter